VGADGGQLGILKLSDALKKAYDLGLDLVEVAPNADPPVAKIIELGKLKYQEEKKQRREKKGAKGGDTKEIRFSPFIGEADYNTRLGRIKDFFADKNKVRVVVKFGGRQMGSKDFGYRLIERIIKELGNTVNVDMPPKFLGRHLTCVISPLTKRPIAKDLDKKEK
jgi:translation initiation factor IF-3